MDTYYGIKEVSNNERYIKGVCDISGSEPLMTITALIEFWNKTGIISSEIKKQYYNHPVNSAAIDKLFRTLISLCALTASFMMSSVKSETSFSEAKIVSVTYFEMGFSFAAAVIALISSILDLPTYTVESWKDFEKFDKAQKVCLDHSNHCKWVRDTIMCDLSGNKKSGDIQNHTLTMLRQQKREYLSNWIMLPNDKPQGFCFCFFYPILIRDKPLKSYYQQLVSMFSKPSTKSTKCIKNTIKDEREESDSVVVAMNEIPETVADTKDNSSGNESNAVADTKDNSSGNESNAAAPGMPESKMETLKAVYENDNYVVKK